MRQVGGRMWLKCDRCGGQREANTRCVACSRRTLPGRVTRWARFTGYSALGAHVFIDEPMPPGMWRWRGRYPLVTHQDGALSRRAAESRALECTR